MKNFKQIIIHLMAIFLLVACGGDNRSGTAVRQDPFGGIGNIPGTTCPGCSESNRLYTAMGRTGSGVDLIMEFFAADHQGIGGTYNSGFGQYSGAVDGFGYMYVATGLSCGVMNSGAFVPMGIYEVIVRGLGVMDPMSQIVSGVVVEANGPGVVVQMRMRNAVFYPASPQMRGCDGQDYGTEMIGQWEILSINNIQCGNTVYFDRQQIGSHGQLLCP